MQKYRSSHNSLILQVAGIAMIGFLLSFISLFLFMYLFETIFVSIGQTLDFNLTRALYMLRTPTWTNAMLVITSFGADVSIAGVFVVGAFFSFRKRKKEAVLFVLSVFVGLVTNVLLKVFFQRLRPDINPLIELESFSYPSGHAMNAFVFYGLLAYYFIIFTNKSVLEVMAAVFSVVLIILIGLSRVYLGVHYPTDVLAGYIAGFWIVVAVIEIDKLLIRHAPRR